MSKCPDAGPFRTIRLDSASSNRNSRRLEAQPWEGDVPLQNVALFGQCLLAEEPSFLFFDLLKQILAWHVLPVDRRIEGLGDAKQRSSLAVYKCQDVRLGLAVKDAAVIGTSLHHQSKGRKLRRSVVYLQAEQVLLQYQRRDVLGLVAALLVNRFEQVVGFPPRCAPSSLPHTE